MMPSRRDFLKILLSTPIAMHLDVEQLLWVPKPIILVPALDSWQQLPVNGIFMAELDGGLFSLTFDDIVYYNPARALYRHFGMYFRKVETPPKHKAFFHTRHSKVYS